MTLVDETGRREMSVASSTLESERDSVLSHSLRYAFFAAVFFPYLRILPIGSDVQPAALALGALVLLASTTGRLPKAITPLLVVLLCAVAVALITGVNGIAVRGLANYFSLFIIAFATYSALKAEGGLSSRVLAAAVWIWFVVGLLQTVVNRDFLTVLLSNARSTANRGVVGLAPEPTAYGIHCLFLALLVSELFRGRRRSWMLGALLMQILLFARSSMTILFIMIWGVAYVSTRIGFRRSVVAGLLFGVGGYALLQWIAQVTTQVRGVRIFDLVRLVATAPALILVRDQSISDRVGAIVFSIAGALDRWFLPHGFISWSPWVHEIGPRMIRYIPYYTSGDRIMSGYGAAVFELGLFGFLIPFVVISAAWSRYAPDKPRFITIMVVMNFLLLSAVPLAYPPVGFLIGYFCYYAATAHDATRQAERMVTLRNAPPAPIPGIYE